jgi:hypothetical protein
MDHIIRDDLIHYFKRMVKEKMKMIEVTETKKRMEKVEILVGLENIIWIHRYNKL